MNKNRGEMWETRSAESLKWTIAGLKSHLTRKVNQARTRKQKSAITAEYELKIQNTINDFEQYNLAVKRHNAAVKANATRKNVLAEACAKTSKKSSRKSMKVSVR